MVFRMLWRGSGGFVSQSRRLSSNIVFSYLSIPLSQRLSRFETNLSSINEKELSILLLTSPDLGLDFRKNHFQSIFDRFQYFQSNFPVSEIKDVSTCAMSLENFSDSEIPILIRSITPRIRSLRGSVSSAQLLKCISCLSLVTPSTSIHFKQLLSAFLPLLANCGESFTAQNVTVCLSSISKLDASWDESKRFLLALCPLISSCREPLTSEQIGRIIFSLKDLDTYVLEVRSLIRVLLPLIVSSHSNSSSNLQQIHQFSSSSSSSSSSSIVVRSLLGISRMKSSHLKEEVHQLVSFVLRSFLPQCHSQLTPSQAFSSLQGFRSLSDSNLILSLCRICLGMFPDPSLSNSSIASSSASSSSSDMSSDISSSTPIPSSLSSSFSSSSSTSSFSSSSSLLLLPSQISIGLFRLKRLNSSYPEVRELLVRLRLLIERYYLHDIDINRFNSQEKSPSTSTSTSSLVSSSTKNNNKSKNHHHNKNQSSLSFNLRDISLSIESFQGLDPKHQEVRDYLQMIIQCIKTCPIPTTSTSSSDSSSSSDSYLSIEEKKKNTKYTNNNNNNKFQDQLFKDVRFLEGVFLGLRNLSSDYLEVRELLATLNPLIPSLTSSSEKYKHTNPNNNNNNNNNDDNNKNVDHQSSSLSSSSSTSSSSSSSSSQLYSQQQVQQQQQQQSRTHSSSLKSKYRISFTTWEEELSFYHSHLSRLTLLNPQHTEVQEFFAKFYFTPPSSTPIDYSSSSGFSSNNDFTFSSFDFESSSSSSSLSSSSLSSSSSSSLDDYLLLKPSSNTK